MTKEYMEKRSGEENGSNRLQIQLGRDGDSSPRKSLMEKNGLWPMLLRLEEEEET